MASEVDEYTTALKKLKTTFDNKENTEYLNDTKNTGFTLPGTKYLGPGNSVNIGEPTSIEDKVARLHDTEYFDAQYKFKKKLIGREAFNKAIKDSDTRAIDNFSKQHSVSGTIGAIGLGSKKFIEKFTNNPIYPNPGKLLI